MKELKNKNTFYKDSYNFLFKELKIVNPNLSDEQINKVINEDVSKNIDSIDKVYELLLEILQEHQMYPSVIKFYERKKDIEEYIGFPDLNKISTLNSRELCCYFRTKYNSTSKTCWPQYCDGIVTGAKFLCEFKTVQELNCKLNEYASDCELIKMLELKIKGMGYALACSFLKDLGYKNYLKPDTHVKCICLELWLIKNKNDNHRCFKKMKELAEINNVTLYMLDRVLWMICSNKVYETRTNEKIRAKMPGKKTEFINYLKKDNNIFDD